MTSPTTTLLAEIDQFLAEQRAAGKRISDTTFGRLAANDGKLLHRLRQGGEVRFATSERIRTFIAEQRAGAPTGAAE